MLGSNYYHGIIPRCVTLFGNIFNDIKINKTSSDGKSLQTIPVPILYGQKDKYISLLARDPQDPKIQIALPRMSFVITNIGPDPDRSTIPINRNVKMLVDGSTVRTSFAERPWNIDFELSIYTKNYIDSTQIVEQIAPFFTPDFNANVRLIPDMDLDFDIKTKMTGVSFTNEFEGAVENTRIINWVMNFTMETYLLGPVDKQGLIRKAVVNLVSGDPIGEQSGTTIITTPGLTRDGKPAIHAEDSINYKLINPTDDYGFIVEKIPYEQKNFGVKAEPLPFPKYEEISDKNGDYTWSVVQW